MPTYEYACSDCGQHTEVMQSFSDAPLTACPNCGGELRKVFSPVGIVLKGSGFYKNDSRSSGRSAKSRDGAGTSETSSSPSSEGSGTSSDKASESASPAKEAPATSSNGSGSAPSSSPAPAKTSGTP